jgi:hypothetical protein
MAITKLTNTITDTNTKYSVQHTGLADDATQLASSLWANLSALKYASATVTLASAPTTNLCIGEVLTTNDGTAIFLRVTDFTAGATTFKAYKVTSATDITPKAWTAETATDVGTGKTLTGGVSGLCSSLTHASTRLAIASPKINLRKLWWNIASGFDHVRVYFDGSDTEQTIAYLSASNGYINYAGGGNHIGAIPMGAAAGNSSNVLGDVNVTTIGAANKDVYMIGVEIGKLEGFELPNFFKNGQLGYAPNASGFSDVY